MTFYKKVDVEHFKLSDNQIEALQNREPVYFMDCPVKQYGNSYFVLLQQSENQIKVQEGQYVVRHGDGHFEILWAEQLNQNFITAEEPTINLANDPFKRKNFSQPTVSL